MMRPRALPRPCVTDDCPDPAALLHADEEYCVRCYRAHPGTILRPLPEEEAEPGMSA
jgi:hypothetical protein